MGQISQLSILVVDDERVTRRRIAAHLEEVGHTVSEAGDGEVGLASIRESRYDVVVTDLDMPILGGLEMMTAVRAEDDHTPFVVLTAHGDLKTAVRALRLGATDYLAKPYDKLEMEAVLERVSRYVALGRSNQRLQERIGGIQAQLSPERQSALAGNSEATRVIREQIGQAVSSGCQSILITGETGVGKEVVAREIHFSAERKSSPFISVVCPSLPDTLIEDAFFGHEKGAFTGADRDQPGYFELADGGTLFLDEIGDMSAPTQAILLGVLENRRVRRLGGGAEVEVNCRVIAATNVDLEARVESGGFRADLFYRLNILPIRIPPLRERKDDIIPIARRFLSELAKSRSLQIGTLTPEAEEKLVDYDYPGNVRELRNIVERATILSREGDIGAEALMLGPPEQAAAPAASRAKGQAKTDEAALRKALEENRWNRRQAARALGITYSKLRYQMMKHGIS